MKPYLSLKEARNAPLGFEFKKKSIGGSIIFKKKLLSLNGKRFVVELHSKNNVWALNERELEKLVKWLGVCFLKHSFSKSNELVRCIVSARSRENTSLSAVGAASKKTVKPEVHWKDLKSVARHRAEFNLVQKIICLNGVKVDTFDYPIVIPKWKKNLNWRKYEKLYENYADPEELHYFDFDSPEFIRVKNILAEVNSGWTVLDVGCNSGFIGRKILEKDCIVFGIDINEKLLKKAGKNGLIVRKAFAEKIPFENCFFDCVVLAYLLEHVLKPEKVLREAWRVLKNGGKLIGSVPTEFGDWGEHNYKIHPEHLRCFSRKKLKALLERKGFKTVKIKEELYKGRNVADSYFFTAEKPKK